jgi:hypothetical protein
MADKNKGLFDFLKKKPSSGNGYDELLPIKPFQKAYRRFVI